MFLSCLEVLSLVTTYTRQRPNRQIILSYFCRCTFVSGSPSIAEIETRVREPCTWSLLSTAPPGKDRSPVGESGNAFRIMGRAEKPCSPGVCVARELQALMHRRAPEMSKRRGWILTLREAAASWKAWNRLYPTNSFEGPQESATVDGVRRTEFQYQAGMNAVLAWLAFYPSMRSHTIFGNVGGYLFFLVFSGRVGQANDSTGPLNDAM